MMLLIEYTHNIYVWTKSTLFKIYLTLEMSYTHVLILKLEMK